MATLSTADVIRRAKSALRNALEGQGVAVSSDGYVDCVSKNLVSGVRCDCLNAYKDSAGHELQHKMKAAHSSSALVVNTFCPWRTWEPELNVGCEWGFGSFEFEGVCPTGLLGTPPHLDVLAAGEHKVVGIESKCTEYIDVHELDMPESYTPLLTANPCLRGVVLAAQAQPFVHLDVSQLVKHSLGLRHTYPNQPTVLLYLFWEPRNWRDFSEFLIHREEIRRFAELVAGDKTEFRAMTYRQLWTEWALRPGPSWLSAHVGRLEARYDVNI